MYTALRKSLNKENDKGFTLIELLVVIIIIGILAAIAIPIFLSQRKKGFEASEKSDARSIATQMETYYTDSQVYPAALTQTGQKIAFTTEDYVVLSPNNSAKVFLSSTAGGGFCVEVSNTNTTKKAIYNSENGGLQGATVTACPAGFSTTSIVAAAVSPTPAP